MTFNEDLSKSRNVLPPGWRSVRLREICERIDYGYTASADNTIKLPKFLRITDIQNGNVSWDSVPGCSISQISEKEKCLADGDIVFARTGSIGKCFLVRQPPRSVFASYLIRLKTLSDIVDASFLYLFFQTNDYWNQILSGAHGGVQSGFNATMLGDLIVRIPSISEQKRIVSVLSAQLLVIEKARLAAEAQMTASNALPDSYLRAAFDSSSARAWPKCRLGDICEVVAKQVDPRVHEYGQLPHVNGENIESGTGRITYLKTAIELGMISGKYLFEPGDVLYSKLRPYLRKATIVDYRGVCSADMYPIRFDRTIMEPQFAAWMLISDSFTKYADEQSRRARMPKLNRDQLFSYKASVPPLDEQREIISRLDKLFSASNKLNELMSTELVTITILPAVLLGRAFTGGI